MAYNPLRAVSITLKSCSAAKRSVRTLRMNAESSTINTFVIVQVTILNQNPFCRRSNCILKIYLISLLRSFSMISVNLIAIQNVCLSVSSC